MRAAARERERERARGGISFCSVVYFLFAELLHEKHTFTVGS